MTDLSRQHQTIFAGPEESENDIPGNCWQACIASLLEMPMDEVPHFIHIYADETDLDKDGNARWYVETRRFVEEQRPGWTLQALVPEFPVYLGEPGDYPSRVILTGKSPRGDWLHSVLADSTTGELVHDPHPDSTGVTDFVDVMALVGKVESSEEPDSSANLSSGGSHYRYNFPGDLQREVRPSEERSSG